MNYFERIIEGFLVKVILSLSFKIILDREKFNIDEEKKIWFLFCVI